MPAPPGQSLPSPDTAPPAGHAIPVTWPAPAGSFFTTPAWWHATVEAALPPDATPLFLPVPEHGPPEAIFPLMRTRDGWQSLTTLYTYLYEPIGTGGAAAFARWCRGKGVVRLDSIDPEAPWFADLLQALRAAGLRPLLFDHFGIWEEQVTGLTWDTYLRAREGRLRETLRRRLRRFQADPDLHVCLDGGTAAIEAYHAVEPLSWKQPEPCPDFNRVLFRRTMADGHLFLATPSHQETPIAVQAWALHGRRATVLKLVHDQAWDSRSPGTVLTALVVRHLLDQGAIDWLDFGRGDDPYKRGWVGQRRQRVGVLIADPWRLSGWAAIIRQAAGAWRRRLSGSPTPAG